MLRRVNDDLFVNVDEIICITKKFSNDSSESRTEITFKGGQVLLYSIDSASINKLKEIIMQKEIQQHKELVHADILRQRELTVNTVSVDAAKALNEQLLSSDKLKKNNKPKSKVKNSKVKKPLVKRRKYLRGK